MATPDEVRAAVSEFIALVPSIKSVEWYSHPTSEVRSGRDVRRLPWCDGAGVYAFYSGSHRLRYVGRALRRVGLGSRVPDHLRDACRGRPDWNEVLDDGEAFVEVCRLADDDAVWAPSLELFLCERFTDLVNRRRS